MFLIMLEMYPETIARGETRYPLRKMSQWLSRS